MVPVILRRTLVFDCKMHEFFLIDHFGPLLNPTEGLRAPELPGANPGDRPKESGGDSKAI